ncbi:dihydrofolate reductase family protein [Agromyces bauzanensis]|uniref:Riboflavin biosynthesis protein n=1 Tax=Agromyces bauzanensis TaxID=1308924 RepID=A0A917PW49_9MICO|nr:dihydrofolate reductase family protein [Agromyces bauzanensis]GGJ94422.1 riboflavin biosynthesis protein [Agromyces bauzanensis]
MTKVIFDISMSLDGFISAKGMTVDEGMGVGGEVLHDWAFAGDDRDRAVLERAGTSLGAVIAGRRTYDNSIRWWGADGPTGPARIPLFVVSHDSPADVPADGVYTFVGDIHTALDQARSNAGAKDVGIMGGADVARQCLRAGLVDEISIHLVPVLFGGGTPVFGAGWSLEEHVQLERTELVATDAATHLRFRVVR